MQGIAKVLRAATNVIPAARCIELDTGIGEPTTGLGKSRTIVDRQGVFVDKPGIAAGRDRAGATRRDRKVTAKRQGRRISKRSVRSR